MVKSAFTGTFLSDALLSSDSGIPVLRPVFNPNPLSFDQAFPLSGDRQLIFRPDTCRVRVFVANQRGLDETETYNVNSSLKKTLSARTNLNWEWDNDEFGGTFDMNPCQRGDAKASLTQRDLLALVQSFVAANASPAPSPGTP